MEIIIINPGIFFKVEKQNLSDNYKNNLSQNSFL